MKNNSSNNNNDDDKVLSANCKTNLAVSFENIQECVPGYFRRKVADEKAALRKLLFGEVQWRQVYCGCLDGGQFVENEAFLAVTAAMISTFL